MNYGSLALRHEHGVAHRGPRGGSEVGVDEAEVERMLQQQVQQRGRNAVAEAFLLRSVSCDVRAAHCSQSR